ncbi:MAG: hypothetical protein JXA69_07750 [Phycisphaerae bacterium]|nr:hypothetical protein [Phycisphaerae bacterium]
MRTSILAVSCCCLTFSTLVLEGQPPPANSRPAVVFAENEHIRVGIHLAWGGAITHVSEPGGPNLINSHDLGRQIQQSYYSGPANYQRAGKRKSPHWASFPWNPIQTGDAFHNGSRVLDHRARDGQLYVKTIPMLWPMDNDPAECVMETWITLSPDAPTFIYRARLTNARGDKTQYSHGMNQEVPAVYVNGPWHRLITYKGDKPFADEKPSEVRNDHQEGWPWVNFLATEGWAALVNDAGTGIGVCVPTATEFHGGFHGQRGRGDEKSANTGYMSPITTEILDHNIVCEYTCTFVLGDIPRIRTEARRVASRTLPAWTFDRARQGWHYQNGHDAGYPLAGRGLAVRATDPVRPVRLIGPMTFWHAEAAPQIAVRISSAAVGTMTIFWRGMPPDEASTRPSEWSTWRQSWWTNDRSATGTVPAGDKNTVTISFAESPTYAGAMTGLAIDIPDGVTIHDIRLLGK